MKQKAGLIARVAIMATGVAGFAAVSPSADAQSNVRLYGLLDSGLTYVSKVAGPSGTTTGNRLSVDSGDLQQSRWGMKGIEDLGGGMKALFILEGGFSVANGTAGQGGLALGRTTVVGLSSPYGTVQIGRRKDYIDEIATWYSSVHDFGVFINGVHDNNLDRVGGNRANNSIRYDSPDFRGLSANVTYGFGGTPGSMATGQSLGFGANYKYGGFGVGFGYWQSRLGTGTGMTNASSDAGATPGGGCDPAYGHASDVCIRTWMVGTSYRWDKARVYASWSRTLQPLARFGGTAAPLATTLTSAASSGAFAAAGSNNDATNVFDVGVNYWVLPNLKLAAAVLHSRYSFVGAPATGRLLQFNVGLDYFLSKRTDLYSNFANLRASHMYNPGITGGAPGRDATQSAVTLGLRHVF
ncbi:Outer membrane porin protein [Pandoraea eparura]|jgi:predicted porin|uniref:Outer membrane porin protein n=1 Tax=Pandoraea eparura TaxID=2508291 RepID=A0A5E4VFN6_9BURK|nr:porin [Pandoraea eparura]VVE09835.1 Outer membrane porin protein [Pandoraea eparura]